MAANDIFKYVTGDSIWTIYARIVVEELFWTKFAMHNVTECLIFRFLVTMISQPKMAIVRHVKIKEFFNCISYAQNKRF